MLSARVESTAAAFGPSMPAAYAFAEEAANGTNLVRIQAGHTIDLVQMLLGSWASVAAMASTQFPRVSFHDGTTAERGTADHLLVQARLASSAPLAIEVAGGRPPHATPFMMEIVGEDGNLILEGSSPRGFQAGTLKLTVRGKPEPVPSGELGGLMDSAVNVGTLYAALRDDIAYDTTNTAGFAHAVGLTRLIDRLLASSESGRSISL